VESSARAAQIRPRRAAAANDALLLLLLTFAAVAVHGYHFGVQDQFLYVPAIKQHANPALYPHDGAFFQVHTRVMVLDDLVALSMRATGLPADWAVFLWHLLSIYLLLFACLRVSRRCFQDRAAQWAATVAVAVMLTLEVAGTLLFLADEYLHPRTLATAAVLLALAAVLDRKLWPALSWLVAAALIHPTMAAAGALHLAFVAWRPQWKPATLPAWASAATLLSLPLLGGGNDAWREVLATRWYLFPLRWPWYAWLGVVVPLALLAWFARLEQGRGGPASHVSRRLIASGLVGVACGVIISVTPGLERLIPAEPMRTLHLFTLMTVLLGGGILGEHFLRRRPWRWAVVFLPLAAAMFLPQLLVLYPSSPHIEWPGRVADNDWVRAFEWVRRNTPRDAYFVLGPRYQEIAGEDFHDFRSLAERSALADYSKDRGVVANWPELAPAWREQVHDRDNWQKFTPADFARLREKYGVTWAIVEGGQKTGGPCPYGDYAKYGAGHLIQICQIP
jgi:Domain of unknown function (DUF6798)